MENYEGPPIEYSNSDYHHVAAMEASNQKAYAQGIAASAQRRKASSQYSLVANSIDRPPKSRGRPVDRQASVAETEKTQSSYDPFRPSKTHFPKTLPDHARVTVLRRELEGQNSRLTSRSYSAKSPNTITMENGQDSAELYSIASSPPTMHRLASRGLRTSLKSRRMSRGNSRVTMSSTRSRGTNFSSIVARRPASYKRNVSFNHLSARPMSGHQPRLRSREQRVQSRTLKERYTSDEWRPEPRSSSSPPVPLSKRSPPSDDLPPVRSRKAPKISSYGSDPSKIRVTGQNWTDDVRKVSTELDQLCDTAFNRVSLSSSTPTGFTRHTPIAHSDQSYHSPATSLSMYDDPVIEGTAYPTRNKTRGVSQQTYPDRPLPPIPIVNESLKEDHILSHTQRELEKTREMLKRRNRASCMEPGYLDDVIAHLDRLMQPSSVRLQEDERRASSNPEAGNGITRKDTFDQIMEQRNIASRSTSAPTKTGKAGQNKNSIRVVNEVADSSKPISPIKPLIIKKKVSESKHLPDSPRRSSNQDKLDHSSDENGPSQAQFHARVSDTPSFADKNLEPIEEGDDYDPFERNRADNATAIPKKRSWFRRNHQLAQKGSRETNYAPPPPVVATDSRPWPDPQIVGPSEAKQASGGSADGQNVVEPRMKAGRFLKNIFTANKTHAKESSRFPDGVDYELGDADSVVTEGSSIHHHQLLHANLDPANTETDGKNLDASQVKRKPKAKKSVPAGKDTAAGLVNRNPRPQQHQNWFARFLRIKPATHVICFQVTKPRARKEIACIFREWRLYGMRDVVVSKEASMIWARVDVKNCVFPSSTSRPFYLLFDFLLKIPPSPIFLSCNQSFSILCQKATVFSRYIILSSKKLTLTSTSPQYPPRLPGRRSLHRPPPRPQSQSRPRTLHAGTGRQEQFSSCHPRP